MHYACIPIHYFYENRKDDRVQRENVVHNYLNPNVYQLIVTFFINVGSEPIDNERREGDDMRLNNKSNDKERDGIHIQGIIEAITNRTTSCHPRNL